MFSVITAFLMFWLFLPKYNYMYPKTLNMEIFLEGGRGRGITGGCVPLLMPGTGFIAKILCNQPEKKKK